MHDFESYATLYRHVHFRREDGILQLTIHNDGKEAVWSGDRNGIHAELADAFYRIGRDRENLVVIFTGTGDNFLVEMENNFAGEANGAWILDELGVTGPK